MGIPGGCRCDDAGQVLAEPARRAWGVGGKVEEVVQIGDQHGLATVTDPVWGIPLLLSGAASLAGVGQPVGGAAGFDDLQ